MMDRLRSIWTTQDLRNKVLYTLGLLLIVRLIAHVPVPGIDPTTVQNALGKNNSLSQIFGLLSVFSGGSIQNFSIVALGVYPYITASIVIQLLQPIIPALNKMAQEGEAGRNRLAQITRYITLPLAFLQGLGQLVLFANIGAVSSTQFNLLNGATFAPTLATLMVLTTGVLLLVWIGELITENGVGNGISLIIFVNIVAAIPQKISQYLVSTGSGTTGGASSSNGGFLSLVIVGVILVIMMVLIVFVTLAQRRIPVQYPTKSLMGGRRAMMQTQQATYIPISVNQGGMIPLIFAQSLLLFPVILASYLAISSNPVVWLRNLFSWLQVQLDPTNWVYPLLFAGLVFAFTYFYATVLWEQMNMAENLRKQGAFIAGVRPGNDTANYMEKVLLRVTLGGAIFLALVAVVPFIPGLPKISGNTSGNLISAASLIIVVQVALDTVKQVQAQMVMRNYSGFLR